VPLSELSRRKAEELIERYPKPRSAMLPLLFLVQAEEGYVSPSGVAEVASLLGVTKAEVGAVATFYTMYHRRPAGKYVLSVCRTLSCALRGSDDVTGALLGRCGIELGGTTPDGMVTVEEVECLAACDGAPVVQVNYENYERLSPEDAVHLVEALLQDEVPPPTFSADGSVTEPSSRGTYWRLAGLGDPPPSMGGPEPVADAPTAFPHQPPGPTVKDDPTTRPIQELRTGVDHGGTLTPEPVLADRSTAHVPLTDEEKSRAQGEEPESEAGRAASGAPPAEAGEPAKGAEGAPAKGRRRRGGRGRKAAASGGEGATSSEDAAKSTEAQAPEPERTGAEPAGGQSGEVAAPADVHKQAGPNQREAPGGDPQ
jgi:NADH-quinone oxidoreductase subunit E